MNERHFPPSPAGEGDMGGEIREQPGNSRGEGDSTEFSESAFYRKIMCVYRHTCTSLM